MAPAARSRAAASKTEKTQAMVKETSTADKKPAAPMTRFERLRLRRQATTTPSSVRGAYDSRHPTYLGRWRRSLPAVDDDIAMDDIDEPHIKRRHAILDKHPQIAALYGPDKSTRFILVAAVAAQLAVAFLFGRNTFPGWTDSPWVFLLTAFFVGGSLDQLFGIIIHEAAHNLISDSPLANRIAGFAANIGIPFPIAASFRRYHLEHHAYQGVIGKDPDLPLEFEITLVRGNAFLKFLFIFFYPLMYVIRGLALKKAPSLWEYLNWAFILSTDAIVYYTCGPIGLLYLAVSLWFGYGVHPVAAHFIQEHFTFEDGQETYSYYGGLNVPFLNIGYHTEHHDFTKVAWSKLPMITAVAPEFYNTLASHSSWMKVHWDFIFNNNMGPQSRAGRTFEDHKLGRKMLIANKSIDDEAAFWEEKVTMKADK